MLRNESVPTLAAPQFLNLTPNAINPGISRCEIKVLYLGANRNGSYISREVAESLANDLPACPIVGAYYKEDDDFGDHGEVIHIERGEIDFTRATIPYGFVSPDAKVWFQNFNDIDEFGNAVERTYLMTTGYLWTGQYPEIERCITEGMGQSMELDDMDGHWAEDTSKGIEFFIITDASLTKLCVLGNSVEPCFEGASVTSPKVSESFSTGDFAQTLFTMMKELKETLGNKGGLDMPKPKDQALFAEEGSEVIETPEAPATDDGASVETFKEDDERKDEDGGDEPAASDEPESEEPAEDEDDEDKKSSNHSLGDDEVEVPAVVETPEAPETPDFSAELEQAKAKVAELAAKVETYAAELEALRQFKNDRISADKDALIAKYHMLSDEDKAEVIEHKDEYSLAEIESKLALIYVQTNVDFDSVDGEVEVVSDEAPVTTFSLSAVPTSDISMEDDDLYAMLRDTKYSL